MKHGCTARTLKFRSIRPGLVALPPSMNGAPAARHPPSNQPLPVDGIAAAPATHCWPALAGPPRWSGEPPFHACACPTLARPLRPLLRGPMADPWWGLLQAACGAVLPAAPLAAPASCALFPPTADSVGVSSRAAAMRPVRARTADAALAQGGTADDGYVTRANPSSQCNELIINKGERLTCETQHVGG